MTATTVVGNFTFQLKHVLPSLWHSLLSLFVFFIVSRGTCSLLTPTGWKYAEMLSADWMKLVKRKERSICKCVCPPTVQACVDHCLRSILTAPLAPLREGNWLVYAQGANGMMGCSQLGCLWAVVGGEKKKKSEALLVSMHCKINCAYLFRCIPSLFWYLL